ncbi:hypothetical protein ACLOJK_007513 [Asimina triloba]
MKVSEKCDVYSYGVVVLELLTGKMPVQPLDQGGDLVTWVRNYIQNNSMEAGMIDARMKIEDEIMINHIFMVLKIALLCTSMSPSDRPAMRQVVSMLIETKEREGKCSLSANSNPSLMEEVS